MIVPIFVSMNPSFLPPERPHQTEGQSPTNVPFAFQEGMVAKGPTKTRVKRSAPSCKMHRKSFDPVLLISDVRYIVSYSGKGKVDRLAIHRK